MSGLLSVGTGVGTNYISSELLKKLDAFKENKAIASFKSYICEWELDFEKTHDGTIATRSCFFECVKYEHILERIISYVLLPDDGPSEDVFLKELQQEMAAGIESACGQGLPAADKDILWCFLSSALEIAKKFLFNKMSLEDKGLFYMICQNQSQLANVQSVITEQFHITQERIAALHNQINALCSNEAAGTFPEEADLPEEFDTLIAICNSTLKKSQSKVRVYAWDDLDFEAVYVLPSLDIHNLAERRFQYNPFNILPADLMTDVVSKSLCSMFSSEEIELLKNRNYSVPERKAQISMAFQDENIVYIIGGAGYGKSLFLKNLCIAPQLVGGSDKHPLLVIYGDLKRLIRPDGSLRPMTEFLEECFTNGSLRKSNEVYPNFLAMCLKMGRCLILLDALDEVSNDKRAELHSLVLTYFTETYPDNKVCITSRNRGFIPDPQAMCVSIRPLTVRAVEEYVDKFVALDKFPLEEKSRFIEQAAVLVEKEFVKGFLTLSLLLAIYKNEQELPANKVLLYEKCFEYIANNREKKKNLLRNSSTGETYDWTVLGKLMSDATFMELARLGTPNNLYITRDAINELMTDLYQKRFNSLAECHGAIDDFLQFCADRTEVFVPAPDSNAEYHFFHRSFYEYFYANYIAVCITTVEETYRKLSVFDIDSEIFELLLALYARRNPHYLRELIQYAFDQVNEHMSAASKLEESVNLLVMMMQAVEENDFIEQFVDLFLHRGGTIAKLRLRVTSDLICNVFAKSNKYLISEVQNNEKEVLPKIRADFILFCLQNMSYCNELLTKNRGHARMPIKRRSSVGFRYVKLLNFLPGRLALLDKWFDDIKDPQYLSRLMKSHGEPVKRLLSFATRVKNQPVKEQEKIYMLLLAVL